MAAKNIEAAGPVPPADDVFMFPELSQEGWRTAKAMIAR